MMTKIKNFLLIPSVPTPNGQLHLGHIGGPYLSVDVLARYLRVCGHRVQVISGTDDFESYVTYQAAKEQKTPEYICNYYHPLIANDLKAMDIQLDQFISPIHPEWLPTYQQWHEVIFQTLNSSKACQVMKERMIWDEQNKRYQTGCWSRGFCPQCQEKTASYFCENCGAHYRPEEIIQPSSGMIKEVENVFLQLPHSNNLVKKGINPKLAQLYDNFLKQQNHLFRLTTQSEWGLKHNESSTLFSYGFVYVYFLMLGELAGIANGTDENAFARDSSVITIASFGHDNCLPFLSSISGISAVCNDYKPFDHYLVNYFYHLDGLKFSTSRRHAIWVNTVIHQQNLSSDIIRLYLASIDVRNQTRNFVTADFNCFYDKTIEWQTRFILQAMDKIPAINTSECDVKLQQQLMSLLAIYDRFLQPDHFLPHRVTDTLHSWLQLGNALAPTRTDYFWWLQAFSLFIYPFMPKLGLTLWQALGYTKIPAKEELFSNPAQPLSRKIVLNQTAINSDLLVSQGVKND